MTGEQLNATWIIAIGQTLETMKFTDEQRKIFYKLLEMNFKIQVKEYEKPT